MGNIKIIFDTFYSKETAEQLYKFASLSDTSAVTFVINSHYHSDHIGGNSIFHKNAIILTTEYTKSKMDLTITEKGDFAPIIAVNNNTSIYGMAKRAEIIIINRCHTEADIILYLPDDKVMFMGDLLFTHRHPNLEKSHPENWKNYLLSLQKLDVETFVSGHGSVTGIKDVLLLANYFDTLKEIAQSSLDRFCDRSELSEIPIPYPFMNWKHSEYFYKNLNIYFDIIAGSHW